MIKIRTRKEIDIQINLLEDEIQDHSKARVSVMNLTETEIIDIMIKVDGKKEIEVAPKMIEEGGPRSGRTIGSATHLKEKGMLLNTRNQKEQ